MKQYILAIASRVVRFMIGKLVKLYRVIDKCYNECT